jgi:tyrosyl-tRNA synthetase
MSSEQSQPPTELSWLYRGTEEIFPHRPDSDDKNENLLARLAKSERPLRVNYELFRMLVIRQF